MKFLRFLAIVAVVALPAVGQLQLNEPTTKGSVTVTAVKCCAVIDLFSFFPGPPQGIMITLETIDPTVDAFLVKILYRDAASLTRSALQLISRERRQDSRYTTTVFVTGSAELLSVGVRELKSGPEVEFP